MDPSRIRITGPLAPHVRGLWGNLLARGYTPRSARNLTYLMAHLSRWLVQRRLSPQALTVEQLESFFRHRRRRGYVMFHTRRSLDPILSYLIEAGVARFAEQKPRRSSPTFVEKTLDEYRQYLVNERCLCEGTRNWYLKVANDFLVAHGNTRGRLRSLTAAAPSSFVLKIYKKWSVNYCKHHASALRSFLRYSFVRGHVSIDLSTAVPAAAGWRLSWLPKGLSGEEVKRLFASCDRRTSKGRRSYAVLVLMIRLGLRAREVAALRLEDIHWRQGEIVVHGKGGYEDVLPVPDDVGRALAAYLQRGRPRTDSRAVFLMSRAPFRGFDSRVIKSVVIAACKRAGISPAGAHRLRHTAAMEMLRHGVPLPEIAQVLRHRSIATTAIYAKVDRASLRTVAQPWPGGAA